MRIVFVESFLSVKQLEGRIALVTGAATGIGLAIARLFAFEGAIVCLVDIDATAIESASEEILSDGGQVFGVPCDVSQPADIREVLERIGKSSEKLDILVNNAGITTRTDFRHMSDEDWHKVMDVNLGGTMMFMREAFSLLQKSGNAAIVNLSSIMASQHVRQMSHYAATKGAVTSLSRNVALEYAPFGIRVNYLCPGFIETKLTDRYTRNPAISKGLLNQTPMRRFGTPEEVAQAALFLASDQSAFITGSGIAVDGGLAVSL